MNEGEEEKVCRYLREPTPSIAWLMMMVFLLFTYTHSFQGEHNGYLSFWY